MYIYIYDAEFNNLQPTPVFLPGKSHGWRSLVGCSGISKSWTRLSNFTFTFHFHALEKEMASHSSILAWRIPGMGEPGGLPSMGSHRVIHDWSDLAAAAAGEIKGFNVYINKSHTYVLWFHKREYDYLIWSSLILKCLFSVFFSSSKELLFNWLRNNLAWSFNLWKKLLLKLFLKFLDKNFWTNILRHLGDLGILEQREETIRCS